jgi:trehalose 6-phosphate synthase
MAERPGTVPGDRPLVVVSNRGPVSFRLEADGPVAKRGAGGLVSALGPLVRDTDTTWVAAAMTEGDRVVADRGVTEAEGFRVRLLAFDPDDWRQHYDTVCNEALWFAHHGLWDPVYEPAWPTGWVEGPWAAHRRVNQVFAEAVAADAPTGAVVLVQDYHLCLMAPVLRQWRPDLALVHFSHTPFAPPEWLAMLPRQARHDLLDGLAAHHACGFHTDRWAADFDASCRASSVAPPPVFVAPLGPDPDDLAATLASEPCRAAAAELHHLVGDRRFLVRVDRIELSKNLLRGFLAFEALLEAQPERRGTVVFGAFCYPSRLGVAAYDRYNDAVIAVARRVNERFGSDGWEPIHYDPVDDYPRSMAALARADVVVVNAVRDGLNLVAKEAALVNRRDAQLVLSPEAGAWPELGPVAWRADPFDVGQTAGALAAALDADPAERRRRAQGLRAAAAARTPAAWLADQLAAAPRVDAGPGRP